MIVKANEIKLTERDIRVLLELQFALFYVPNLSKNFALALLNNAVRLYND